MPRTDMKININGQMVALPEGFDDYIDWSRAAIVELDMHGGHLDPEPDCPAPSARGRNIIDDVNKFNQACRDLGTAARSTRERNLPGAASLRDITLCSVRSMSP